MIWSLIQNPVFVLAAPGAVVVFLSLYVPFKGGSTAMRMTVTTMHSLRPGELIALDDDTGEPMWVVSTSGSGPYTSVLSATPTWRIRLRLAWRRLREIPYTPWKERP